MEATNPMCANPMWVPHSQIVTNNRERVPGDIHTTRLGWVDNWGVGRGAGVGERNPILLGVGGEQSIVGWGLSAAPKPVFCGSFIWRDAPGFG